VLIIGVFRKDMINVGKAKMNQQERDDVVAELKEATGLPCYYDNGDFVLFRKRESGIYRQLIIKEISPWVLAYGSKYAQARVLMNKILAAFSMADSTNGNADSIPEKGDEAVWCRIKFNCGRNWYGNRKEIITGALSLYKIMCEVGILGPVEDFRQLIQNVEEQSSITCGVPVTSGSRSQLKNVTNEELVDNVLAPGGDPFPENCSAVVVTVEKLLRMNLRIPEYQRPYKWTRRSVEELMQDIRDSVEVPDGSEHMPLKHRLGTVIVDASSTDGTYEIVDGQQRILTLLLINRILNGIRKNKVNCPLLEDKVTMSVLSRSRISRKNLHENYAVVKSYLGKDYEFRKKLVVAFNSTLEMVVVKVSELSEAFQLFDSQNTRGRALDPHDLLKAFHLRAMVQKAKAQNEDAEEEMRRVVTEWEAQSEESLRSLFDDWLFRISNWSRKRRTHPFTSADIHEFKGVPFDSEYSYALRAKAAMPREKDAECRRFQIGEDFEEGREFFRMVSHYLRMVEAAKSDALFKDRPEIKNVLKLADGKGFSHVENMFRCALMSYVDRFGEDALSDPRVVDKLCLWAFILRLDMNHVSEDSINKYAVIEGGADYSNTIPMFSIIKTARTPSDIAIQDVCGVNGSRYKRKQGVEGREQLQNALKKVEA
jgi:hypothetical protein